MWLHKKSTWGSVTCEFRLPRLSFGQNDIGQLEHLVVEILVSHQSLFGDQLIKGDCQPGRKDEELG